MSMKSRTPQDYSPDEFASVVAMIQGNADLRKDIEAITGQKIAGKSPRELFDLFRTIQNTTEVQAVVVNYGRARQAVRDTRAMLEADASAEEALQLARKEIERLSANNEALKRKNQALAAGQGATPLSRVAGGKA